MVVPEPPDTETLQSRDEIVVEVQGSNEQGYTLTFRAEDANVPFEVASRVIDGSGRSWPVGTKLPGKPGDHVRVRRGVSPVPRRVRAQNGRVLSHYQVAQDVPVWDKVTNFENVLQERLRGAVHSQIMGGNSSLCARSLSSSPSLLSSSSGRRKQK